MSCEAHTLAVNRRFLDWEDVDLIRAMVADLPRNQQPRIVDLGAGSGTTAGAIFAERPDALVCTIDQSAEALHWAGIFVSNIGASAYWTHLLGDSVGMADSFADGSLDMVLIDTSHEYEPTVREIAAWLPKLIDRGSIWFHDYRGAYPGVTQAVNEAIAQGLIVQREVRGLGWGGRKA